MAPILSPSSSWTLPVASAFPSSFTSQWSSLIRFGMAGNLNGISRKTIHLFNICLISVLPLVFNPISILHDLMSDDHCDVNDDGNADAMGYASQNPTRQMLSPILSTELTVILQQVVVLPSLQYR
uniref:Bm9718 n=1 Tax=Brugia malayi TaxID=6279 RepID=A0A1I9G221_BRUMA|nr:Bm9718 [Brugia malayi]